MTEYVTIERGSPLWPDGQAPEWAAGAGSFALNGAAGLISVSADSIPGIVQKWNDANLDKRPFDELWSGGDGPPADWDGGEVLFRQGFVQQPIPEWPWQHGLHGLAGYEIIAYRSKQIDRSGYVNAQPPQLAEPQYPARTHDEILAAFAKHCEFLEHDPMLNSDLLDFVRWIAGDRVIEPDPLIAQIADAEGLTVEQAARIVAKVRGAGL